MSGRFINGYSTRDLVLALVYRYEVSLESFLCFNCNNRVVLLIECFKLSHAFACSCRDGKLLLRVFSQSLVRRKSMLLRPR